MEFLLRFLKAYVECHLNFAKVLLVTAHPDDEVMFFAPAIQALSSNDCSVEILCLSIGNANGLGRVRRKELTEASKVLQVRVRAVVDDPELQDGLQTDWSRQRVAAIVSEHLAGDSFDTVLTFDARGASGHMNHRAVHEGIR